MAGKINLANQYNIFWLGLIFLMKNLIKIKMKEPVIFYIQIVFSRSECHLWLTTFGTATTLGLVALINGIYAGA